MIGPSGGPSGLPHVVVVVLFSTALAGAVPVTAAEPTGHASAASAVDQSFDHSTVAITVSENGSARWTFRYRLLLENESEREAFRTYAERFNTESTERFRTFRNDSKAVVERGERVTDRNMSAVDFARNASIRQSLGNDLGIVQMSFTWTNFAEVSGSRVIVGDVFEGGLYIGPSQTLVFHPGPDLVFVEVRPDATWSNATSLRASDSVTWEGERQFTDNRPYVVFEPVGEQTPAGNTAETTRTATSPTPTQTASPTATPAPSPSRSSPAGLLGGLLVVMLGGVGLYWWHTSGTRDGLTTREDESPGAAGSESAGATAASTDTEGGEAAHADGDANASGELTDEELLSDEGRVVSLLEANDQQMKQSEIVEETGWSKSKVSMLLSDMADDGRVEKLRLGRENVITLAEEEAEGESAETESGRGDEREDDSGGEEP